MNPNRDEILRELIVQTVRGIIVSDPVLVKSLLKYDEEKDYSDPLSIPTRGFVEYLISSGGGGSGVTYRVFLIPVIDPVTGDPNIVDGSVNITGRTNEQGDTVIPSDANVNVYQGGKIVPATYYENGLIEGLDGSLDIKVVLIGGEGVGILLEVDGVGYSLDQQALISPETESFIVKSSSLGKWYNQGPFLEDIGSTQITSDFPMDVNLIDVFPPITENGIVFITNNEYVPIVP